MLISCVGVGQMGMGLAIATSHFYAQVTTKPSMVLSKWHLQWFSSISSTYSGLGINPIYLKLWRRLTFHLTFPVHSISTWKSPSPFFFLHKLPKFFQELRLLETKAKKVLCNTPAFCPIETLSRVFTWNRGNKKKIHRYKNKVILQSTVHTSY